MSYTLSGFSRLITIIISLILMAQVIRAQEPNSQVTPPATNLFQWMPHDGTRRLNQKTNDWLKISGEVRLRAEGRTNAGYNSANDDAYLLTRVRLNFEFRPNEWLNLFVQAQDSHVVGAAVATNTRGFENTFDLRQAYVDLHHRQRKGWGLRLGRQELRFGDERLLGRAEWGNISRSFDAAQLYYEGSNLKVNLLAAAVVQTPNNKFDRTTRGDQLFGIYSAFPKAIPRSQWDVYFLHRKQAAVVNEAGVIGSADRMTIGTRMVGKLSSHFDYALEIAGQKGKQAGDDINAWAMRTELDYNFINHRGRPHLDIEYNYASGDKRNGDGRAGTFDQLFAANHRMYGVADLVGWRNVHNLRFGAGANPHQRLSLKLDYHSFWLASNTDALYNAQGIPVARVISGAQSRKVGHELDLFGTIKLSEHYVLSVGAGHLFAGAFLQQATPGASSTYPYLMLSYSF